VIEVGQRDDGWTVQALPTDSTPSEPVKVDLNVVRRQVAQLFRAWRSHDRLDDAEQAQLVGQVLYGAIFPPPINETLERCLFDGAGSRLDISLRFAPSTDADLAQLPWEQVYYPGDGDERGGKSLAMTERLTVARVLSPQPLSSSAPESSELSVLLLHAFGGAEPRSSAAMRTVETVKSILQSSACIKLDDRDAVTGEELADLLSRTRYDVLHYLGAGRYLSTTDALAIKNDDDDETGWLRPGEFTTLLGEEPAALVILQACKQAPAVVPGDLTVFAPHLLRAGVENVVAWQSAVEDPDIAKKMMTAFYRTLCEGKSVREAVRTARLRTKLSPWNMPAHFARGPGQSRLVSVTTAPSRRWGTGVGGHA
jgi:CHAT domain-containing protein